MSETQGQNGTQAAAEPKQEPRSGEIIPAPAQPVGGKQYPVRSEDDSENALMLDRARFEQAWSVSNLLSRSELVPAHFRGKAENCFIAVDLAFRFKMNPFMVMQGMYVVQGKPGLEGKFIIALINKSGLFADPLDFDFSGTEGTEGWTCTASAKRSRTGKLCSLPFTYATAVAEGWVSKQGSKWKTMPHQMMCYRAATFFARLYCPEVIMGMQSEDEINDVGAPSLSNLPSGRSSFLPEPGAAPAPATTEAVEAVKASTPETEADRQAKARVVEQAEKAKSRGKAAEPQLIS